MPPKKVAYIPGLNARPDDLEVAPYVSQKKIDTDLLIDNFLAGRKNPTMCLHEYCSQQQLAVQFKQEPVEYRPGLSNLGTFGCRAIIDDLAYPQGVAVTKKDAKNEASRLALRALIGIDDFVPEKIEPELDDSRFAEVRTLSDLCDQKKLVCDKMMTKDKEGDRGLKVIEQHLVRALLKPEVDSILLGPYSNQWGGTRNRAEESFTAVITQDKRVWP